MKTLRLLALSLLAAACGFAQPSPVIVTAATQAQVNAGTNQTSFVSPFTLAGWSGGGGAYNPANVAITGGTIGVGGNVTISNNSGSLNNFSNTTLSAATIFPSGGYFDFTAAPAVFPAIDPTQKWGTMTLTGATTGHPNEALTIVTPLDTVHEFTLVLFNSDSVVHNPTFTASGAQPIVSMNSGSTRTSWAIQPSQYEILTFDYDGTNFYVKGDPVLLSIGGSNLTGKTTPVANDVFALGDSAAGFVTKGVTFANLQTAIGSGFTNPMNAVGDLILGGTAGAATRLGIGSNTFVLTSNGTTASWAAANPVSGFTFTANAAGFSIAAGTSSKTLKVDNTLELAGTDSTVMTFPSTSASIARIDAGQTFAGTNTFSTITGSSNLTVNVSTGHSLLYQVNSSGIASWSSTVFTTSTSLVSTGQGGVGYATGAGGTVTQATNRSTAVTINKIAGVITGNGSSLAGLATAVFTVNDTSVAAGDTVILSEASTSAAAAATLFKVTGVGANVFTITELNTTAATADTGIPVWNFVVIKGASS